VLQARAEAAAPASAATVRPGADDSMDLLAPPRQASRLSVFHDLLHQTQPNPAARGASVDLLVGDTSGYGVGGGVPSADDPLAALYAGLGMTPPASRSPQQTRLIGALLRASIAGTLGLLATRTIAKRELGAGRTMPQSRENNPLKFATDTDAALAHLLGPPQRGFIAPIAAVDAAFADLRAHELAVLAGMRAALEAVLARFDPQALEARFAGKGMWDNLVPVNHRARLWERYVEQHAEIMREVEDDFDSLFGGAFLEAYEAQLARLGRPLSG
jgi:type VI secretion system FHA domain protein